MRMACSRLDAGENAGNVHPRELQPVAVRGLPHVKAALMAAVVDAIAERVEAEEGESESRQALNRVRKRLND